VLTMNKDYWRGWQEGQFTKVILQVVEDPTVRDQMIRSGGADITEELPFDSLDALKQVEGITVLPWVAQDQITAFFALKSAPMDNLKVRQALEYSFPYEAVNKSVFSGYGTIPPGFGPTSLWKVPADFPSYNFDLDKAKTLLKEAGFDKGFELNLAIFTGSKEIMDIANLWQAELAKIGVKLNIQPLASGPFWDYAYNPDQTDYQMMISPVGGDVPSPYSFLIVYTSSPLGWFPAVGYKNDKFDKLVFDAWAKEATEPAAAMDLWVQAQRILHDDAASVFIIDYPTIFALRNNIIGYVQNPPYTDIVFWYDLKRTAP
jgi:peptide/nickel transport system substrate-binding protein